MASPTRYERQAQYAIRLAMTFPGWVRRRIETFQFVDAVTVRRKMSVDFSLPRQRGLKQGDPILVPIMILEKGDLRNFDLVDREGRSLHLLTSEENSELAQTGLELLLKTFFPAGAAIPSKAIEEIVTGQPSAARRRAKGVLSNRGAIGRHLDQFGSRRDRSQIRSFITDLADGFLMLVPMHYESETRQLVKFSYDAAHTSRPQAVLDPKSAADRMANGVTWVPWLLKRFFSYLGLMAREEVFPSVVARYGRSYHAEVVPPTDTRSAGMVLEGKKTELDWDGHGTRPHVRTTGFPSDDEATARVYLSPDRQGLILPLFVSAAVIAGTLAHLWDRAGLLRDHSLAAPDGQVLAALLLIPFALAAYFIRSSENSYVTRTLAGVRLVAGLPALGGLLVLSLLGLGVFADPEKMGTARDVADVAAQVSVWCTALLGLAMISPWLGRLGRRVVRISFQRATKKQWGRTRRLAMAVLFAATAVGTVLLLGCMLIVLLYIALPIENPILSDCGPYNCS